MTDLLNLAQRLEDACDITGKPIGRHMVDGMKAMAAIQERIDDTDANNLAAVTGTLAVCIENEAKLFDDLAAVVRSVAEVLRAGPLEDIHLRGRELDASEQMRDRIADYIGAEIAKRNPAANSGAKVRKALMHIEREIRRQPGRIAQ